MAATDPAREARRTVHTAALELLLDTADAISDRADEVPLSWVDDADLLGLLHAASTIGALAAMVAKMAQDRVAIAHGPGYTLALPHTGRVTVGREPKGAERHDIGLVLSTIAAQVYQTDIVELPAQARAMVERFQAVVPASVKLSLPAVRALGLTDQDVVSTLPPTKGPTVTYTPPEAS